jgi:hypothetical protein
MLTQVEVFEEPKATPPAEATPEEDSVIYDDPDSTIRYNKAERYLAVFNKKFNDLLTEATGSENDFWYEKTAPVRKRDPKSTTKLERLNRQGTKKDIGTKTLDDEEEEIPIEVREENELVAQLQTMGWNRNLRETLVMPDDLRMSVKRTPEFYRALTYLIIKKGLNGHKYDKLEKNG